MREKQNYSKKTRWVGIAIVVIVNFGKLFTGYHDRATANKWYKDCKNLFSAYHIKHYWWLTLAEKRHAWRLTHRASLKDKRHRRKNHRTILSNKTYICSDCVCLFRIVLISHKHACCHGRLSIPLSSFMKPSHDNEYEIKAATVRVFFAFEKDKKKKMHVTCKNNEDGSKS